MSVLTVSAGGDVDGAGGGACVTDSAHSVLGADAEGVGGVWEEPADDDPPPGHACLRRLVGDAVCAGDAGGASAAHTLHAVGQIRATAAVQRLRPLQRHHRIIDLRDDAARSRRRSCRTGGQRSEVICVCMCV